MTYKALIPSITKAFEIEKGSIVLLQFWGENTDLDILDSFALEVGKNGGIPIKWQYSREFLKRYFIEVEEANLTFPDRFFEIFNNVDTVIDIFMNSPALGAGFPKERMPLYGGYMQKLMGSVLQTKEKYIQLRVPTQENAAQYGLDFEVYSKAMLEALSIDFDELKESCKSLKKRLENAREIVLETGSCSRLSLVFGDRAWHCDDGTGDSPCGEIYTAPLENHSEGEVFVEELYFNGERYFDTILEFKAGQLIKCSSQKLEDELHQLPEGGKVLCEFGIGLNKGVTKLTGCTAIDEKCYGTVHIAIGMNTMFGGANECPCHIDFVLRPAKLTVDGATFVI